MTEYDIAMAKFRAENPEFVKFEDEQAKADAEWYSKVKTVGLTINTFKKYRPDRHWNKKYYDIEETKSNDSRTD